MKLVEAAPIAGALRFEILTKGRFTGRGTPAGGSRRQCHSRRAGLAPVKAFPPEAAGSRTRVKVTAAPRVPRLTRLKD